MNLLFYLSSKEILRLILMMLVLIWATVQGDKIADDKQPELAAKIPPDADLEKLPGAYLVSIRRQRRDLIRYGTGHICGGALITPILVLSAAHCFTDQTKYDGSFLHKSEFNVVLGGPYRYASTMETMSIAILALFTQQEKFDFKTYDKDIAVVVMKLVAPLFMQPIELVNKEFVKTKRCQISGWSRIEEQVKDQRLHFNVMLIDKPTCKSVDGNLSRHLMPGMVCVVNDYDEDACIADSGGPLICSNQLVGIHSWGVKCGMPRQPAIYTDVLHYRKWIVDTIVGERWKRVNIVEAALPTKSLASEVYGSLNFIAILVIWHF